MNNSIFQNKLSLDEIFESLGEIISSNLDITNELDVEVLTKDIQRIFVSGSGGSAQPAKYFDYLMTKNEFRIPVKFINVSEVLEYKFNKNDLMVLITLGGNSGDSVIIANKVKADNAKLMCVTGNPLGKVAQVSDYILPVQTPKSDSLNRIDGSIITLLALIKLSEKLLNKNWSINNDFVLESIYSADRQNISLELDKKTLILSSREVYQGIGWLAELGFREALLIDAKSYEVQAFGHGYYMPYQVKLNEKETLQTILIQNSSSKEDFNRVADFLNQDLVKSIYFETDFEGPKSILDLTIKFSFAIYKHLSEMKSTPYGISKIMDQFYIV